MLSKFWQIAGLKFTIRTFVRSFRVIDDIVLGVGFAVIAMRRVMWTMPMILPFHRPLLEDLLTVWAKNIVSITERFVQR